MDSPCCSQPITHPVLDSIDTLQDRGQLVFFVGGTKTDVETLKPYFEAMGKAVNHVGASAFSLVRL
jgi:3-hydroxyisobutyrate dehydrogenase-like beta-hydroxyacid dehydrogenase